MSSYLNIVIPIKDTGNDKDDVKDAICIVCVSRNHPLYGAFADNISLPFGEENVRELTMSELDILYDDVKKIIDNTNKRINELEKHANGNIDFVNEILSSKEYRDEELEVLNYIKYLMETLSTMKEDWRTVKHKFLFYCN